MAAQKAKVRALQTFVTWGEDEEGNPAEVVVREGDELPADHPIVEGHRELFRVKRAGSSRGS
jgi:hypothetical protein